MCTEGEALERDRRLASARALLREARGTGEIAEGWTARARVATEELSELLRSDSEDVEVRYRIGWLLLVRNLVQPLPDDQVDTMADAFAVCLLAGVDDLPDRFLPGIASVAEDRLIPLLKRARTVADPDLLNTVVEQYRRVLDATPADHPGRPQRLGNLGIALHLRFDRRRDRDDLDAALVLHRAAVDATPEGDPELAGRLNGLAGVLRARHEEAADPADLDAAVDTMRRAADATSLDPARHAMCLSNLGLALRDRFQRTGDAADLDDALSACRRAWELTDADEPYGGVRLHNLAGALVLRCRQVKGEAETARIAARLRPVAAAIPWDHPWMRGAADAVPPAPPGGPAAPVTIELFALCFLAGLDEIPTEVASGVTLMATNFAIDSTLPVYTSYDPEAHEAAIELWRRIAGVAPPGDPHRHVPLGNLSFVLLLRYQRTGTAKDLDGALDAARRSVREAPDGHPGRGLGLGNLAAVLMERFRCEDAEEDLDLAIDLGREAVRHIPEGSHTRAQCLRDLGAMLGLRFTHREDPADLDDAADALREAIRCVPPDPLGPGLALLNLGEVLGHRYTLAGTIADLDESVTALRAAAAAAPEGHAAHAACLSSLGDALRSRFERLGDAHDVDEAVDVLRKAVAAAPPGSSVRTMCLHNLTSALYFRMGSLGGVDLDELAALARETLASVPEERPEHASLLGVLANVLRARFEETGDPEELEEAVEIGRQLTLPRSDGAPYNRVAQTVAGSAALILQHLETASGADLDGAIAGLRTALRQLGPRHTGRMVILHNLALALATRSGRAQSSVDLDAAIDAVREALEAAGPAHSGRPMLLNGLGSMLQTRFVYSRLTADLDASGKAFEAAFAALPPRHPMRYLILTGTSHTLLLTASATGSAEAADAAVAVARDAVDSIPVASTRRPWSISLLSRALLQRHRCQGSTTDLDEAVSLLRGARREVRTDHVARPIVLLALADVLGTRSAQVGTSADLDEAVRLYAEASALKSTTPLARVLAAATAGRLVADSDPARAADLLETAVTLLPRVAPRQLHRREQQFTLGQFGSIAGDAAALALNDTTGAPGERALRALRMLETGRGVLLSQSLDVFSDASRLRLRSPRLADRYEELRDLLDRPESGTDALTGLVIGGGPDGGAVTGDRHRLTAALDDVLAEIRRLDGFDSFGLPPSTGELLGEAHEGAVVVLNVSSLRGDALLLTRAGVTAVPLPALTPEAATRAADTFRAATHDATEASDDNERRAAQDELSGVLAWLWDAVAEPVLTALGHDRTPDGDTSPRVWWVPCGPLSPLPIHAAGRHDRPGAAVLDRVVSSYTPTVRALHHARRPLPEGGHSDRALVVAMPTTPGHPPLDWALDEADVLEEHFPDRVVLGGPDAPPTSEAVLRGLPDCGVAHFACHGDSDVADPSHSLLLLQDHRQSPFTVARLASVRLDHARLAYLSACRTAVSHADSLLDEAIHLASAFQLSGFRHVIGTLWPVVDDTAVEVAEAFYAGLSAGGTGDPDPERSAYALHTAVRALRERLPGTPSLWASHIHTGA